MTIWHQLFMWVAYSAFGACVYAAYKTWLSDPAKGAKQLATIAFFAFMYWLLESWGYYRAPYYFYPSVFPDMIDHFDWMQYAWFRDWFGEASNLCAIAPSDHECTPNLTRGVGAAFDPSRQISLSVLFLEASLTWSVMTTALLFNQSSAGRYLQPFLVALVLVLIDAFLDPVLSESHDIATDADVGAGVRLWQWCVCEDLGLSWLGISLFRYGVPVFNNAVWFAGPVILVALAMIFEWVQYIISLLTGGGGGGPPPLTILQLGYTLIVLFGALLVFAYSPSLSDLMGFQVPIWLQNLMLILLLVGTVVATLALSGSFVGGHPLRLELAYPAVATMLLVLITYLFAEAGFLRSNLLWLWLVALVSGVAVVLFARRPYQ